MSEAQTSNCLHLRLLLSGHTDAHLRADHLPLLLGHVSPALPRSPHVLLRTFSQVSPGQNTVLSARLRSTCLSPSAVFPSGLLWALALSLLSGPLHSFLRARLRGQTQSSCASDLQPPDLPPQPSGPSDCTSRSRKQIQATVSCSSAPYTHHCCHHQSLPSPQSACPSHEPSSGPASLPASCASGASSSRAPVWMAPAAGRECVVLSLTDRECVVLSLSLTAERDSSEA